MVLRSCKIKKTAFQLVCAVAELKMFGIGAGVIAVALLLNGCSPSEPNVTATVPSDETVYPMRGIVREVRQDDAGVIIEHEDVPGYMPAMTMPFNVRDKALFDQLKVGEAIAFELVVKGTSSWIRQITATDASTLQLAPKRSLAERASANASQSQSPRVDEGDLMPDFRLLDQLGHEIDPQTFAGKDVVVTFIFTRCPLPDFCPRMSSHFAELEKAILENPDLRSQVRLLSVTIDPKFDTPAILKEYADHFSHSDGELWRFAVGTQEQTDRLTHAFSVHTETSDGTINHTLCTAWIGSDGTVKQIWRGNAWEPKDVLSAINSTHPLTETTEE